MSNVVSPRIFLSDGAFLLRVATDYRDWLAQWVLRLDLPPCAHSRAAPRKGRQEALVMKWLGAPELLEGPQALRAPPPSPHAPWKLLAGASTAARWPRLTVSPIAEELGDLEQLTDPPIPICDLWMVTIPISQDRYGIEGLIFIKRWAQRASCQYCETVTPVICIKSDVQSFRGQRRSEWRG